MILSSELKLRKTVNDQRNFIISEDFSIEVNSYTEDSYELNPTEEKSYSPNKGIIIFCNSAFTISIYNNDKEINRFYGIFSDIPVTIKNTGEETLKFTVIIF